MTHEPIAHSTRSLNPVAAGCYSVAFSSFAAAILGLPVTHWPVAPLAGVGVFYLIVALFCRTSSSVEHHGQPVKNLVAETAATRETSQRKPELATAQH